MLNTRAVREKLGDRPTRFARLGVSGMMEKLKGVPPDRPAIVLARSEARDVRKGHGLGTLYAVKKLEVLFNKSYQEAVNENRKQAGLTDEFRAGPRSWGELVPPFVLKHNESRQFGLYLSMIVLKNLATEYQTEDGTPVPREAIRDFIKPPRPASPDGVQYRNYDVHNVMAICLRGPRGGLRGYMLNLE